MTMTTPRRAPARQPKYQWKLIAIAVGLIVVGVAGHVLGRVVGG